jgi:hypothetical protein
MAITLKEYPDDYPKDVQSVFADMTMGGTFILLGSASIREQLYAGDFDGFEEVNVSSVASAVSKFKSVVRRLQKRKDLYVGDIKAGFIKKWKVLPDSAAIKKNAVVGYDAIYSQTVLEGLHKDGLITAEEYKAGKAALKPKMEPRDFTAASDILKFHVVRWTPKDILAGKTTLRDGSSYSLGQALTTPTVAKMDVIGWIQNNHFAEFSVVYEFHKGKEILNPTRQTMAKLSESLTESIIAYREVGNYFKVLKRIYSLARLKKDEPTLRDLTPILNSDLGRLYYVLTDINTLMFLLEHHKNLPEDELRLMVDQFIGRLSNVSIPAIVGRSKALNSEIRHIETLSLSKMSEPLKHLADTINSILQAKAKPFALKYSGNPLSGGGHPLLDARLHYVQKHMKG